MGDILTRQYIFVDTAVLANCKWPCYSGCPKAVLGFPQTGVGIEP